MSRPNVLLVVLDSVRAKNTSVHGYGRETTPAIERFSRRATTYNQAKAPGVWTLASHTSMFTGYHVEEHLLTFNDCVLDPGHTVWERLAERGYRTGVFSHNPFLTGGTGLEAGFETVVPTYETVPYPDAVNPYDHADDYLAFARAALADGTPVRSVLNGVVAKFEPAVLAGVGNWAADRTPAEDCVEAFLDWHRSRDGDPWGACLNLMDAHWPYRPRERQWADGETAALAADLDGESLWQFEGGQRPWAEWEAMEDLYDDCIRQADAAVGTLLRRLEERGELENTVVAVTGDHGEAFGETSAVRDVRVREHGSGTIHESVLHVPLVVHWPGAVGADEVDEPTSLTWLATAFDVASGGTLDADPLYRPDTPVLASTHGLSPDESKYRKGAEYVDDMRPFAAHSRAVYEAATDGVRKYADCRRPGADRTSATVRVGPAGERTVEADTDAGHTAEAFAGLEDAGVRGGSATLDDQTVSHLEDLGYM